jgi:preprotein translocase subunit SecY
MTRLPGRLAITLGLPAAIVFLGERLVLPGVPAEFVARTNGSHANVGVFALGVMPILSAYWIVEVVAFLVPRWSRLRHGNPQGRAKLERSARVLAMVLAALQGFGVAISLGALAHGSQAAGVNEFSISAPIVTATLVGGVCVQFLVAQLVTRQGLLNGLVALFGAGIVRELIDELGRLFGLGTIALSRNANAGLLGMVGTAPPAAGPRELVSTVVAVVVLTVTVLAALRAAGITQASSTAADGGSPYRDARRLVVHPWIPVPASSLQAYMLATSLLMFPATIANLGVSAWKGGADRIVALLSGPAFVPVLVGLTGVTMVVVARLMHRPAEMSDLAVRLGAGGAEAVREQAGSAWRSTLLPSFFFFLAVILAGQASRIGALTVVILVTILLDLVHAVRVEKAIADPVPVWEERRPSAVPALRAALAADGIASETQGMAFSSLWQVFAPYAPARLLVRAADRDRAMQTLGHLLVGEKAPARGEPTPGKPPDLNPPWSRARQTGVLAGCVVAAGLAWGIASLPRPHDEIVAEPRPKLEIVRVDDSIDPFAIIPDQSVPAEDGIEIRYENVPLGRGVSERSHFARVAMRDGEPKERARVRLQSWLSTVSLPAGARFGVEDVVERDEDARKSTVAGLRTFVLRDDPVLRTDDVTDANVAVSTQDGEPDVAVSVTFSPEGARRFEDVTREWTNRRLAIVIDDEIVSAPVIKTVIRGGRVTITMGAGDFDVKLAEAKRLERGLRRR